MAENNFDDRPIKPAQNNNFDERPIKSSFQKNNMNNEYEERPIKPMQNNNYSDERPIKSAKPEISKKTQKQVD